MTATRQPPRQSNTPAPLTGAKMTDDYSESMEQMFKLDTGVLMNVVHDSGEITGSPYMPIGYTGPITGSRCIVSIPVNSVGALTLNILNTGAHPIRTMNGVALGEGAFKSGFHYELVFFNDHWRVMSFDHELNNDVNETTVTDEVRRFNIATNITDREFGDFNILTLNDLNANAGDYMELQMYSDSFSNELLNLGTSGAITWAYQLEFLVDGVVVHTYGSVLISSNGISFTSAVALMDNRHILKYRIPDTSEHDYSLRLRAVTAGLGPTRRVGIGFNAVLLVWSPQGEDIVS